MSSLRGAHTQHKRCAAPCQGRVTPPEEGRPANAGMTPIQQARWAPEEGPSKAGTQPKATDQGPKPVRSTQVDLTTPERRETCTQGPVKDRDQGQHDLKTKSRDSLVSNTRKTGQFDCQGNIPSPEVLITPPWAMRGHVTLRVEVARKGEPGT